MKSRTLFFGLIMCIAIAAGLMIYRPLMAAGTDERLLKEGCLKATVNAIQMEIKSYEQKIDAAQNGPGNPDNIPVFKKRIAELKNELIKYQAMDPASYVLPEKMTVTVSVNQPYREGSLLEVMDMTKSGPFYHLAGIMGGDYNALKAGQKYTMTVYFVYKKDYVLPFAASFYVYAADYTVPSTLSLSPRQTGEEILQELSIKPNTITIRVASNGGTDKSSFKVDVNKEEGIRANTPHYLLTISRVKPDENKALMLEGVLITFDLEKDLGLKGLYTLTVTNRVYVKP